jgi:hypothetical protein
MTFVGDGARGPFEGQIRGGDLLALWGGGSILAADDAVHLYHRSTTTKHQQKVDPDRKRGLHAAYPPPVFQVWARMVPMGYTLAVQAAMSAVAALLALGAILLARVAVGLGSFGALPPWVVAGLVGASPAGLTLLGQGQLSGIWLALLGGGLALLAARREFAGAVVLGLLCMKPTIGAAALAGLVAWVGPRGLLGFGIGGAGVLVISLLADGTQPWLAWLHWMDTSDIARVNWMYPPRQLTLRSALGMFAERRSDEAITLGRVGMALGSAGTLAMLVVSRRAVVVGSMGVAFFGFAATLSTALLALPHLLDYDAVVHGPALLATAWWVGSGRALRPRLGMALGVGAWLAPLQTHIATPTNFAVGVLALVAWVTWMGVELAAGLSGSDRSGTESLRSAESARSPPRI